MLAEWDPFADAASSPRSPARVKFGDIVEGVTMTRAGSTRSPASPARSSSRPRTPTPGRASPSRTRRGRRKKLAQLRAADARYMLPEGANIVVADGDEIDAGDVIAKMPARDHQDQGHHRRSAARGRALRGPQAQGARGHRRDRRRGLLRQGHQGQAQGRRHPRDRRRAAHRPGQGVPDPQGQAHQRARGRPRARPASR